MIPSQGGAKNHVFSKQLTLSIDVGFVLSRRCDNWAFGFSKYRVEVIRRFEHWVGFKLCSILVTYRLRHAVRHSIARRSVATEIVVTTT